MEPFVLQRPNDVNEPTLLVLEQWTHTMPGLSAGFTTRLGGVSDGACTSLNCALHVHDDPAAVINNRKRVATACGLPFEAWTCAEQVHGNHVYPVTLEDRGKGRAVREQAIQDADALITDLADVMLTSFYADCVPLLFVDPVTRVTGLAHAGWKGTVSQIAARTVQQMQDVYGCNPDHIHAAIGPSIGSCCYEVDERVIKEVCHVLGHANESVHASVLQPTTTGHAMLDLRELNRHLLIEAGILAINIECTKLCTGCRTDLFFSHRVENGNTGRMMSWIGWQKG
ncbi:peptidoglycan editing factor PgeF [Paenibacillus sp. 481]|uniref:peptidoglycan editing factor PgeF n=1 Tax=Paenibacillus sp. 481 TaxID=2835869 RepID=UPI001E28AB3B|nr:peptidoglycan editing factor PgeF [Paenibacillus sp. 481]UHA74116.1 peptidoglycan editing factor PgeF [Paenibacillus sp. 481]